MKLSRSTFVAVAIIALGLLMMLGSLAATSQAETSSPRDAVDSASNTGASVTQQDELPGEDVNCASCHGRYSPGIVEQYEHSEHFAADVTCQDCHLADAEYPGATAHPDEDFYVLARSSTARCEDCHEEAVAQFYQSRHALPAYVAYAGSDALNEAHLEMYASIPEGGFLPGGRARNALYHMEGPAITRFACEGCHDIGKPNLDGSIGDCTTCHLRHEFNLEQARKPETCNACHIGPDHPQWEIYQESPHGIAYMTMGHEWNWEADPDEQTVVDFPAPTCATCHLSNFGAAEGTHDVGERLTWFLFPPISTPRPNADENRIAMQNVCLECHSQPFVTEFYTAADEVVYAVNDWVVASDLMLLPLIENDLLTSDPFDEPIDYTHFNIWHHWGRTAKFGTWMQGPDYVQWHGAYEIMHDLATLREEVDDKLIEAGLEPLDMPPGFPSLEAARAYIEQFEAEETSE